MAALQRMLFIAAILLSSSPARGADIADFADTFFRYTGTENKPFFSELPGETVDPFTGSLHLVQQDLLLPGKAGLDLAIVRSYTSKIWSRADLLDVEPLMAELDPSILGYGWSLHFGRLRGPWASGDSALCGGHFPIFQEPDGTSHVFYPAFDQGSGVFVSKDYWRLEQNCGVQPAGTVCVWSDRGIRYEFSPSSVDRAGRTRTNLFSVGITPFAPVTSVVDPFGNRISITYLEGSGAPDYVVDTYGRALQFSYADGVDGRRLISLEYNGKYITYDYMTVRPEEVYGHTGRLALPGPRRFLTVVTPPAGPSTLFAYASDVPVANNQYALSSITYPAGGTTSYEYEAVPFFTGVEEVAFSVVRRRTVSGRGLAAATWEYTYSSPAYGTFSTIEPGTGLPSDLHLTTISRPDGKQDTYLMYGFGWAADQNHYGYTYAVGLTKEIARGDRSEVETYDWGVGTAISNAIYSAPIYGSSCEAHFVADGAVYAPVMKHRWLERDQATFATEYSNFDSYGQAQAMVETGYLGGLDGAQPLAVRTTTTAYFRAERDASGSTLNMVRGRPLTQTVCIGSDCVASSWRYDEPGYPLHVETKSGVTTTFTHRMDGDLSRVTDALGRYLELSDYRNGVPRILDYNGAFTTSRSVTWEGWVEEQTNGRGYTTTTHHDAIGRPTRVVPPGRSDVTEYAYAPDGSSATVTRLGARPYAKTSYQDGLGRVTSTIGTEGVQTSTRYDAMGRAWFTSYPFDAVGGEVGDKLDHDALGRVTLRTRAYRPDRDACDRPGACTVSTDYKANCVEARVWRGSNYWTRTFACNTSFGDPAEQRLAQVADAMNGLWQYQRSTTGNVLGITAPVERGDRTYQYDTRQFLVGETTPESGATRYDRNAIGQMTSRIDARNVTTVFQYDALGRLSRTTHSTGSADDVVMDHDNDGNVTLVSSQNGGALEYQYDELDRVTVQTWTFGGHRYETLFHYDTAGCLDTVTYPTGTMLSMTCDAANRVTRTLLDGAPVVTEVVYHPSGRPSEVTYGNGVSTVFGLDDRGRVASVTAQGVFDLRYGYDAADNVISIDDANDPASARRMTYDAGDRLKTVTADGMWGLAVYEYDELGNRISKQQLGTTVSYGYDASNRLTSSSYEAPDHGSLRFTWDDEGRLAWSSDGVSYRYDGRGRRVAKIETAQTTLYHYDPSGRVIAETLPDGTKLRDYVYLGNQLVAVDGCISTNTPPCNERQWYHTDTLGSAVARTDVSGGVVARLSYEPWGEEWSHQGEPGDRQYNGRVYDPGTGFHDYGARMYWPQIGRFISADSYQGDPANPASLNRYSYVQNNPYKYTDPTGHDPVQSRILENPVSYDYLNRSGLADRVSWGYVQDHGFERDAAASQGLSMQGMTLAEKNHWEVNFAALEAAETLAAILLGTIDPAAGFSAKAAPAPTLNDAQAANLRRFQQKLPAAAEEVTVEHLQSGSKVFRSKVPGKVPGSYATYEKTVDAAGETTGYTKTTVDPAGKVVHVKDKM